MDTDTYRFIYSVFPYIPQKYLTEAVLFTYEQELGLSVKVKAVTGDMYYLYADQYLDVELLAKELQSILRRIDPKILPYLTIEGSVFSDNLLDPDAFGGCSYFITADIIKSVDTHEFLLNETMSFLKGREG